MYVNKKVALQRFSKINCEAHVIEYYIYISVNTIKAKIRTSIYYCLRVKHGLKTERKNLCYFDKHEFLLLFNMQNLCHFDRF